MRVTLWILIVPTVPGASELHDLDEDLHTRTMSVARKCGQVLKQAFNADKINTAAIGNMVPQLHIHVVARHKGRHSLARSHLGRRRDGTLDK